MANWWNQNILTKNEQPPLAKPTIYWEAKAPYYTLPICITSSNEELSIVKQDLKKTQLLG